MQTLKSISKRYQINQYGEAYFTLTLTDLATGKETAAQRTYGKATFKNGLRCLLERVGRSARQKCYEQAPEDVAKEHENEVGHFVALDKSCRSGVEFQLIAHHGDKCEGEEHASHNVACGKETNAGSADGNARHDGRFQCAHGCEIISERRGFGC